MNHVLNKLNVQNPRFQDPIILNRFLIEKGYNLEKAQKLYEAYLKYRIDQNINNLINEDYGTKMAVFKRYYPKAFFYQDKEGRPVLVEKIGKAKFSELFKVGSRVTRPSPWSSSRDYFITTTS